MSTLSICLSAYAAGIVVAAFVAGFFRIRLGDMPVGIFAAMWPIVLPLAIFDTAAEWLANAARRLRDAADNARRGE